jgi:uncharacterized protein
VRGAKVAIGARGRENLLASAPVVATHTPKKADHGRAQTGTEAHGPIRGSFCVVGVFRGLLLLRCSAVFRLLLSELRGKNATISPTSLPLSNCTADCSSMLASKRAALTEWLEMRGSVLVGFSGGVDSAFLAVAATQTLGATNVVAALGVSASLAPELHERARRIASEFGVTLREVTTHELDDADYIANRGDRCFFCKQELWHRLAPVARDAGINTIADGTIADDLAEHRPGARAGSRAGVVSPLAECGFTKGDVRQSAREMGIPNWDASAAPCLSSRVAVGVSVTPERLERIDRAESALRALGIDGDLRVRHLGDAARIELPPDALEAWRDDEQRVRIAFAVESAGFDRVLLDQRGYRRGALQESRAADVIEITSRRHFSETGGV